MGKRAMKMTKVLSCLVVIGILMGAVPCAVVVSGSNEDAIDTTSKTVCADIEELLDVSFFSQRNDTWKDKPLDHSTICRFKDYGCAVTSVAMVLKYFGYDTNPLELNKSLTNIGALGKDANLVFTKVEQLPGTEKIWIKDINNGKAYERVPVLWDKSCQDRIRKELSNKYPVIGEVRYPPYNNNNIHFIVFYGVNADKFYFQDPYDDPGAKVEREWEVGKLGNGTLGKYKLYSLRIFHGNLRPIASFRYSPKNPIVGEEITFNASASYDPDEGAIIYYNWEFYKLREYVPFPLIHINEGPDKKIIKYSFYSEGTYQIHLTVTDDEGEVNSTDKYIEVKKTLYEPLDIVLVTDVSGSMDWEWKGEKKIDTVKKAAKTFLNLIDKTNDRVGLVSFADSATFDLYLTNDFHRAKNTIDGYSAYGRTNIGDALTRAVNEQKTIGRPEAAKAIILLTDGNITIGMSEYEVLTGPVNDAAGNDIMMYSLGYGVPSNLKEEFLTDVAENTGGKYYYVPSPEELENIYLELSGRVAGLTPLAVKKNQIHQDEIMSLPFFIDVTIDMFRAMLNWAGSDLDLRLKNPSGGYVVPDDAKVRYSGPNTKPEWYELIHPEPGIWTAEIHGKDVPEDYENFTMQVMASSPITLSVRTDRATYDGGEPVLITAELKEGVKSITGTHVFAEITMPDGSSETLKLYDDGTPGDIYPGDRIYTNSFRKTYWVGLYEVKASATDGFTRVDTTSFRILTPFTVTTPLELWSRTFGGKGEDYAEAVIQTSDGGYAIAGWTTSYSAGSTDAWLVKTDRYGNEEWNKTFGGYKRDAASSIIQTSDGGYVLAGHTESYGKGSDDFWLIKTDSYGDVIWSRVFGSRSSLDEATSIVQASDGGYVIAGIAAGNGDAWLVKTDRHGNELWNKTFGGHSLDTAESLIQTSDGGYAFAGVTLSYNAVSGDAWLVKTDSYGNEQWNKTFGAYNWEAASSIIQTSDGGYAIAGCTCSYGKGSADFWVLKTNCYGNKEWSKTFGGDDWDEASSIIQTSDGGYAIVGWTLSYGAGSSDAWFMKTDSYGDEEWSKTLGGYNPDGVRSIIQKPDGYYIIAGWTRSYGAGSSDIWLIKLIPPGMMIQSGADLVEDLRRVV
jgi:Mg-chelatase subunit ChlD